MSASCRSDRFDVGSANNPTPIQFQQLNDLCKRYFAIQIRMSTGSPGWRDLKVRSELQDDALAGTVVRDYPAEVGKEKVQRFSEALKELHRDVLAYRPANEEESVEQEALSKKLECGLQIYDLILRDSQG